MNIMLLDIISGEKFQDLAQIYLGYQEDFTYNPYIEKQPDKCLDISKIPEIWNNPSIIFCYSHRIEVVAKKLESIQNPCVFIFTNSDENLTYEKCKPYLNTNKIHHIFCQNIQFSHEKATFIPLGIANKQWAHGNPMYIQSTQRPIQKVKDIFCSFNTGTNTNVRTDCLNRIRILGIEKNQYETQKEYIDDLALHKFCICPEGNGDDTHRFWECLYVETVPIVVRSPLTEQIHALGLPCVLIDSWKSFYLEQLPNYASFVFDDAYYYSISFTKLRNTIMNEVSKLYASMNVVLSFIGNMPAYSIECIQQLRLFFDGPIYFIYSEIENSIKEALDKQNIRFIHYDEVLSKRFDIISKRKEFCIVDSLEDRKELFKRSYERIYLLDTLLFKYNLKNVWFMEIDILMFCNPNIFTGILQTQPYAYCFHDFQHCSSAIFYVRDHASLQPILQILDVFTNDFISEMRALSEYHRHHQNDMVFPLIPRTPTHIFYWKDYNLFYTFVFDGAVIGQYLFGIDREGCKPYDTTHISQLLNIWQYGKFEWHKNDKGLFIPYYRFHETSELLPIANMHIHSKDLISAVSYTEK